MYEEKEIENKVLLCNQNGNLNPTSIGWSRFPVQDCNLSNHFLRKKKWNYWCFTNEEILFSVTLANLDYAATGFIYLFNLKTKEYIEKTEIIPFGIGCTLGTKVDDKVFFENKKMKISIFQETEEKGTRIKFDILCKDFNASNNLVARLSSFQEKQHQSLNVIIPWDNSHFQFTSKQNSISTEGEISVGNVSYTLKKETTYATLDFGRGIWKYSSSWNWASFSGKINGKKIGINLGAKWTDNTGYTENAILFDNEIFKVHEDINFIYDSTNFMKDWILKTKETDQINLVFHPIFERIAQTNLLILKSTVHQMFGYFTGYIRAGNNFEKISINEFFGWSEEHYARW